MDSWTFGDATDLTRERGRQERVVLPETPRAGSRMGCRSDTGRVGLIDPCTATAETNCVSNRPVRVRTSRNRNGLGRWHTGLRAGIKRQTTQFTSVSAQVVGLQGDLVPLPV